MYFFQSSPVSYKRFIKRFPTENSLIKLYAKTCVDFDIESYLDWNKKYSQLFPMRIVA